MFVSTKDEAWMVFAGIVLVSALAGVLAAALSPFFVAKWAGSHLKLGAL